MSKTFAQQPTPRGNGGVHIDVLTEMWRDLCRHASALMSDLRQCTRAGHDQARAAHGRAAEHLLKSASSGQWPCVSRDGDVEVPSWAERRRHERWTVEWSAQLLGDGQHFPIEVFDVSQGGFGVKCTSAHAPGAHVSILLPTGACYDGAVAWVAGSAFGVSLFSPMKLDDAAIAHARLYGTPADRDKL